MSTSDGPSRDILLNRVTIVVPVYGDWPSLRNCVASLIEHADPASYDVLLVNDSGPDAAEIGAGLLGMIYGNPMFRYEENPSNLGFVRTCNRAVNELDASGNDILLLNSDTRITAGSLDEMRRVLALSEHHGVVCARSNDATIATLPLMQRKFGAERDHARTKQIFDTIALDLPRYYVAPVAIGFCFLVRRSLIDNHGLFDEVYGRGYNEENDFCMRVNALGYSSLIANHALVFHVGSTSFGSAQRDELERKNSKILLARYPSYLESVREFIRHGYDIADRLSDLIVPDERASRPKVLIDLHHMSPHIDGSTRNALSLLEYVASLDDTGAEITVAAPAEAITHFDLARFGLRVVEYRSIDEPFDIGFALAPVTDLGQLTNLNQYCLRWVVSYLDIIALRSWQLRMVTPWSVSVVRAALTHADRVIAISNTTLDDAVDFFPELNGSLRKRAVVLHQGSGSSAWRPEEPFTGAIPHAAAAAITSGGYAFIVGNSFAHKQLEPAVRALADTEIPVVVLGGQDFAAGFPSTIVLHSGSLSDNDLAGIYANAAAVVFPTAYEGFGLPLVEAIQHGKPVVAFDTKVAREIVTELAIGEYVRFFSLFSELAGHVKDAISRGAIEARAPRSLTDYNAELWHCVVSAGDAPVDLTVLRNREAALRDMISVGDGVVRRLDNANIELSHIKTSRTFALAQRLSGIAAPARRLLRRRRAS